MTAAALVLALSFISAGTIVAVLALAVQTEGSDGADATTLDAHLV